LLPADRERGKKSVGKGGGNQRTIREIERGFVGAGWRVTDDASERLMVGNCGKLSILAYESFMGTDDPAFELLDRRRVTTYWVRVIPTPRQAAVLLEEHGGLPEGQRGNPYK
jgi:hypothetical protein